MRVSTKMESTDHSVADEGNSIQPPINVMFDYENLVIGNSLGVKLIWLFMSCKALDHQNTIKVNTHIFRIHYLRFRRSCDGHIPGPLQEDKVGKSLAVTSVYPRPVRQKGGEDIPFHLASRVMRSDALSRLTNSAILWLEFRHLGRYMPGEILNLHT